MTEEARTEAEDAAYPQDPPDQEFHIVGVGASAGGLEALEQFFDSFPETHQFAFVVVQHLSPDYKSLMAELLAKHTRMSIHHVLDGTVVEPGGIYLIPRKQNMTIYHGRLFLFEQAQGLNLPIDIFFRSLAEDQGERSIGVILSGTGSDGTRGIRAIKEVGGLVVVQDEETAKFDGMPRSAISTGLVDYILPPGRMAAELANYVLGRRNISELQAADEATAGNRLSKVLAMIRAKTGVDLSYYKESTIIRRVERRMGIHQLATIGEYIAFLEEHPPEIDTLFKELLIGVTKFFRDDEAFSRLKSAAIPEIVATKSENEPIRVWVSGCSTGEEAYSLAIIFSEYLEAGGFRRDVKIFATDIDKDAIEFASYGMYPESIAADASPERLAKFFLKKGESYQIIPAIREKVIFAYHNVSKDPPFRRMDLISCRNMLIYLQPVLQKKVLSSFQFSLRNQGFLFLGSSESVGEYANSFDAVDARWKIYRYKGGHRPTEVHFSTPDLQRIARSMDNRLHRTWESRQGTRDVERIYEKLIGSYLPPSVLINESREVLHVFGQVDEFLRLPLGRVNLDVLNMAKDDVSIPLATALQRAMSEKEEVSFHGVLVRTDEETHSVSIQVRPFRDAMEGYYYIIIFQREQGDADAGVPAQRFDLDESVRARINELERELQYTKENLQATIEELETSNEELQATNEELLASNEELQSTNEELQSVNEELITVNSEYQKKIEELSELNDDMNNLLSSTDVGTIFLDSHMTIRKYTPAVTDHMNIIKTDIGRPVGDLSHNLRYDGLLSDIEEVMRTLAPKDLEVENTSGQWFLLRILPYRSGNDRVSGTVVTMVDITNRKKAELSVARQHELLMRILETSPAAITMVDRSGRIVFANRTAEELIGVRQSSLQTYDYNAEAFRITDADGNSIPDDELPFSVLMRTGQAVSDFSHWIERPDGTRVELRIYGNPIYDAQGQVDGAVFSLEEARGC